MKHTIEYDGVRKTVEAKRTATVLEVLERAFPAVGRFDFSKVKVIGVRVKKKTNRRKGPRTVHVIDEQTSYRDELLARVELTDFLTKRY